MTTDGSVSGSLFDSCSLYFGLLLMGKGGVGGEGAEGRLGRLSSQPLTMPNVLGGLQTLLMDMDMRFPGLAGVGSD